MHWNGPFAALLFINHWEYTRDLSFARASVYPLLTGLLAWWQCYLTVERDPLTGATVYHDDNKLNPDASHEGQPVPDPQIALAFVKRLASAILDIAPAIGVAPPGFAIEVLQHLTAFNTATYDAVAASPGTAEATAAVAPMTGGQLGEGDGFTVWNHTRCFSDLGFLPVANSVAECEANCAADLRCDIFTFCPSRDVEGCDKGPSCWRYSRQVASGCDHNRPGFTSGQTNKPADGNNSVWTAARNFSVANSDMFAMYPIWPTEFLHRGSPAAEIRIAQASSRVYSDFATGRPVELFPAAVRAGTNASSPVSWTAKEILDGLDAFLDHSFGSNRLAYAPGGGVENVGISRAVNEMLVQAPGGAYVELFPVWPPEEPATFTNLRTKGGFLISAS